jgi:S-(hydroxymethyl)glutathione dehydrogenase / alcohol dehydrogenase
MKSRAAICLGPNRPLEIDEIEVAGPRQGEVLIQIKASGLCHTDHHLMDGSMALFPYPIVLGHEGSGIVIEIGPGVTTVAPGDHVLPVSMPECGQCANCISGRTNLCLEFFANFTRDGTPFSRQGQPLSQFLGCGTFSNYTTVKEIAVAKIRADAPFNTSCYISCGVATGVGAVTHAARVPPGAVIVVFGLGGVGLNVIQGARISGARRIIGVDINPDREALARSLGATDFINPKNVGDIVPLLQELTGGGADYAFECVGNPVLMRQALEVTRPGLGIAVVIGGAPIGQELHLSPMTLLMGRTLRGSMLGGVKGRTDVPRLVDLYMQGQLKVDELITHYFPLEQINAGFCAMREGKAIRAVVVF